MIALTGWLGIQGSSADPLRITALIAGGVVAWTLFEYAMHRYLFHLKSDFAVLQWVVYLIHGNHHASPNDPLRGLMPLTVSLPVGALIWAGCLAALGADGTWLFLGFMSGYVFYDLIHFACHQWPMRGTLGSMLKTHHMRHHYVDEQANYAISSPFWDRVFGSRIRSLKREEA